MTLKEWAEYLNQELAARPDKGDIPLTGVLYPEHCPDNVVLQYHKPYECLNITIYRKTDVPRETKK